MRWSQAGHRGRPQRLHCTTARFVRWYAQLIRPAANFASPPLTELPTFKLLLRRPPARARAAPSAVLLLLLPAAVRRLLRLLLLRALRRGRADQFRRRALQIVGVARAVGVGLRGEAQARVVHAADRAVGRERARADEDGQQ